MARETKIGLLVGLGVIIFIGILVSDHLSLSQRQGLAGLTAPADARLTIPREVAPQQQRTIDPPIAQRADPLPDPESAVRRDDARADHTSSTGLNLPEIYRIDQTNPDNTAHDVLVIGQPPVEQTQTQQQSPPRVADQVHHTQPGDTLSSIALKYYGDRNYWRTIYEANRDKMTSPSNVRVGVRLVIPKRAADRTESTGERATPITPVEQTPDRAASQYRQYTIQPGDSLSKLAQQFMGTQRNTDKLYELNRNVISDPDTLVVGTVIRVPAR